MAKNEQERKLPPILPRQVVQFAWGLTIEHSTDPAVTMQAEKIRKHMEEIKMRVKGEGNPDDIRYIDNVYPAIDNYVRTLHSIIRGRSTNFEESDRLRDMYIANIESASRFSLNLQSAIGRVSSMTIGGSTVGAIFAYCFPNLPEFVLPFSVAVAAASAYSIYQVWLVPHFREKTEREEIKNDYKRNLYYQQYVQRSKEALLGLFTEALDLYNVIYKVKYDEEFDEFAAKDKFIENLMRSLEVKFSCELIHDCYHKNIFLNKVDLWATCESGRGIEGCDEYKSRVPGGGKMS